MDFDEGMELQLICRACGHQNLGMVPISDKLVGAEMVICDVLKKCASVQVHEGDQLPQQVCAKCVDDLRTAFIFKKRCEEMDTKLRKRSREVIDGLNSEDLQTKTEHQHVSKNEAVFIRVKEEPETNFLDDCLEYDSTLPVKLEDMTIDLNTVFGTCNNEESDGTYMDSANNCHPQQGDSDEYGPFIQNTDDPNSNDDVSKANDKLGRDYICEECGKGFTSPRYLQIHRYSHAERGEHVCKICSKVFKTRQYLRVHEKIHTDEKPHVCSVCGRGFSQKPLLKRHILTHSSEKPFKCALCDYSSTFKEGLRRHTMTHTGEKPFKCELCGLSCALQQTMRQHMKTHGDDKPFKCEVCDSTFFTKQSCQRHTLTHGGNKLCHCTVCGFSCTFRGSLNRHMLTHSREKPFKCHLCDFSCIQVGSLKRHSLIHTGAKLFHCDVCDYTSNRRHNVVQHVKTHAEKPFRCGICNYGCIKKGSLRRHMMNHCGATTEANTQLSGEYD